MLYKLCNKCGTKIEYGKKYCEDCEKIINKEKKVNKRKYNKQYDSFKRDKVRASFYAGDDWKRIRKDVMNRYNGLCLYSLLVEGKIVPADVVHHIVELKKDWDKRYDIDNLIPLCTSVHSWIHTNYTDDEEKMLRELLARWKELYG